MLIVFNGKRNGTIRTEHIKLRHQDNRFLLHYKKGITNLADYLSRHGIPWEALSKNEKNESSDSTNLLYTLHVTPILDATGIKELTKEANNDPTLNDRRDIIRSGKLCITNDKSYLTTYKQIISEITVLNNGTLLKQNKKNPTYSLHEKAISLAHNGSYPGQNALKRRFRNHFYIKDLDIKVTKYFGDCSYCQIFTQKTTRHPIEPNSVSEKC